MIPAGKSLGALLLAACLGLTPGCAALDYYAQAVSGHLSIMTSCRPVKELLADPDLDPPTRAHLELSQALTAFAARRLGLEPGDSYQCYTRLDRPYVAWNLFAAPRFSLKAKTWCYPLVGCLSYRGYFAQEGAQAQARELASQGWEVYVAGVRAYSTLGWLDDPLLSTWLDLPPRRLAALIFHELAHAKLFVKGDTAFNEGFASAVEREGVARWLAAQGQPQEMALYETESRRAKELVALVGRQRQRLEALYAGSDSEQVKATAKAGVIKDLRADYAELKKSWGGYAGYDVWMAGPLNNAQLASLAIYEDLTPAFTRLLADLGGDLPAFYERCEELGKMEAGTRHEKLKNCSGK